MHWYTYTSWVSLPCPADRIRVQSISRCIKRTSRGKSSWRDKSRKTTKLAQKSHHMHTRSMLYGCYSCTQVLEQPYKQTDRQQALFRPEDEESERKRRIGIDSSCLCRQTYIRMYVRMTTANAIYLLSAYERACVHMCVASAHLLWILERCKLVSTTYATAHMLRGRIFLLFADLDKSS